MNNKARNKIENITDHKIKPKIGVYPGTFDPITNGHMDIIKRALEIVDKLIIAIADDTPKTPIFTLKQRVQIVKQDIAEQNLNDKVDVSAFNGLLIDFAAQKKATIIIRGLRAVSDFEYEFQLAAMNSRMAADIQTVFLPASENTQFISSRLVKEIARLGGDVTPFVSENVAKKLMV